MPSTRQPIFTSNLKSVPYISLSPLSSSFFHELIHVKKNNINKRSRNERTKKEEEERKHNRKRRKRCIRNARKYGEGLIVGGGGVGWDLLQLIEGGARRILRTPPGAWRPTADSVFRYLCCWIQGARGVQECPPFSFQNAIRPWLLIIASTRGTVETVPS